ncbi:MAG: hypothetical protein IKI45_14070, partial [Oscillospiraceae bacterium]|nr:hypothetical protein [Oscillospiraceae bacterium]
MHGALPERQYKSFGRAFSPRRARLRIAKALRLRTVLPEHNTPQERQYKSFDQTFSKVCGVEGQSPRRTPQSAELPQRSGSGRWEFEGRPLRERGIFPHYKIAS